MAGFIQGKNCILKVNTLGDYLPLLCAKSFTLTVNTETVETTTQGTGPWKTFDYDALTYTISFDGAAKAIDTNPIVFDMITVQTGFIEIGFQALYIDDDNVIQQIEGVFIVTQTTLNAIAGDTLGFGVEFQGSGSFTKTRLIDPRNLRIIVTGSSNGTALFRLIDGDNNVVYDSGTLNNAADITATITAGNYYYYIESDSTANENEVDVDTPSPIHHDFDGDPFAASSYPVTTFDFTADRTVTFKLGIASVVDWSFDEQGAAIGTFTIYRNGVPQVINTSDNTGTLTVSGGDDIRITLSGTGVKTLLVVDETSSTTLINITQNPTIDQTFTATAEHTYTITSTINVGG